MRSHGGQSQISFDAGPQPGARQPAPGRLGLVQAFVNSRHDIEFEFGADLLRDPQSLTEWVARRGFGRVRASAADHRQALTVRAGLHALLVSNNGGQADTTAIARLNAAAAGIALNARLETDHAELVPDAAGVDAALATILAIATTAVIEGSWYRLKACQQHDCGWAFFDHSRAATGNWCSMRVCGARAKQRAYYRRARR